MWLYSRCNCDYEQPLTRVNLSSDVCLNLAGRMTGNWLSKDIKEWAGKAKHGDVFVIDCDTAIVCLALDPQWPFTVEGPGKLYE